MPRKMSRKTEWTKKEDAQLRKLEREGVTRVEIAKELGRTPSSVNSRCFTLGLKRRGKGGRPKRKTVTLVVGKPKAEAKPETNGHVSVRSDALWVAVQTLHGHGNTRAAVDLLLGVEAE